MVFLNMVLALFAATMGSGDDKTAAPAVDGMAQVRDVLSKLDGVESIHAVKLRDGSLQVKMRRKQGTAVPLNWRDGMQQASYTYWGADLSFTLSRTQRGFRLDCLDGVITPVSGPLRTRNTYVKTLELELDGRGVPYYRSTSIYWGPLGRQRSRSTILTAGNLPTDGLLKQLQGAGAMDELQAQLKKIEQFDEIKIVRTGDGKLDVTISGNPKNLIAVNRQMGLHKVESIELGKSLSFRINDDGKTVKIENIKNAKVNVEILGTKLSLDLKSVVLSKEKDGSLSAKAEVTNPLDRDKTMLVPFDLKNLFK